MTPRFVFGPTTAEFAATYLEQPPPRRRLPGCGAREREARPSPAAGRRLGWHRGEAAGGLAAGPDRTVAELRGRAGGGVGGAGADRRHGDRLEPALALLSASPAPVRRRAGRPAGRRGHD